jgi:phospho-N-acetylmuramoyl-pentapeptide-transferase
MRQILISGAVALFFALFGTPVLIRLLAKRGYGQIIRDDGPSSHHIKRGTPTMGGLIIIFAAIAGYLLSHGITQTAMTASALLVIALVVGLGFVGFLDDWLKISREKSLGLKGRYKILGQVFVAATFGYFGIQFADNEGLTPISLNLSAVRDTSIVLGGVVVVIWIALMVTATSNGVNLTDGLDGLATGASVMTFLAFILIGIWEFGQSCAIAADVAISSDLASGCYSVRDPLDLAVLAAAFAGACTGFLWWNASPAKIFMGDTGSLALGGALAGLASTLRVQLLLIPLGGLFVIITMSVIIQTLYFKATGGKRIFRMAPLHHHFELKGWGEVTIVLRFWIIAGLCVALGLGLFYAQWLSLES